MRCKALNIQQSGGEAANIQQVRRLLIPKALNIQQVRELLIPKTLNTYNK